jgi:F-type H+-transporting ATPase subunit b
MLDISPILLLSSAIVFLIVLARLNSCLYTPLLKHMDERTESIKKDLELAQNNAANVDEMYNEASKIIANAKQEASSIRQSAYDEAKTLGTKKVNEFKSELEAKYVAFSEELASNASSLKNSLVNELPSYKEQLNTKINSI